ncbi:MAG: transposase, partial [Candidatus Asgardarchaeum sp.]
IFNTLDKNSIDPVIRVRKDSSTRARGPFKRGCKAVKELGYEEWRRKTDYGYRWIVEGIFSVMERMFGEVVRSHKPDQIVREGYSHFLYNKVISV